MKFPEPYRFIRDGSPWTSQPGDPCGLFIVPAQSWTKGLKIIATDGQTSDGVDTHFEHVSVSHLQDHQTPSWEEMDAVRHLFWEPEQCVVQYHPADSVKVNLHRGCLHLWRWKLGQFPTPPLECV
jgi:hypothetical protein